MRSAWESCPDIYGKNSERPKMLGETVTDAQIHEWHDRGDCGGSCKFCLNLANIKAAMIEAEERENPMMWVECNAVYYDLTECADGGSMCQHETGYHVIPYAVHEAKQKCNRWAGHVGEHTYIPGADTVPCGESLSETPGEGSEPLKADQWVSVPSEAEELQRRVAQIAFDIVVSRTRANLVGRRNGVDMVDVRIPNNEWNKLVDAVVEWETA